MKKTHYVALSIITAITLSTCAGFVSAQTSTPNRWTQYSQQRQKELENRKEKLASTSTKVAEKFKEREEKLASTSTKVAEKFKEREEKLASTTAKFEERMQNRASSTQARITKLADRFKTGVSNKIANVVDRLGDVINHLKDIDTRIVSRIQKLKSANVDTTKADSLLVDAQTKLATATQNVSSLTSSVQLLLTNGVSTTTKASVKTKIAQVQDSVKVARAAYTKVVENLQSEKTTETSAATTTQ